MSSWTDRLVAAPAWLAYTVRRLVGGSKRAMRALLIVLLLASVIPTIAIGSSQRPTDLTFDDVRLQQIPANTTWIRLEGDLTTVDTATGTVYHLSAPGDDQHYVVVTAIEPLDIGSVVMTGHLTLGGQGSDIIGFLDADVPAVPRRDEPFQLILLPTVIAIVLLVGMQLGYPVIRRDRPASASRPRGRDGDPIAGRWSGRIGGDSVDRDAPVPVSLRVADVAGLPEMADLMIEASQPTVTTAPTSTRTWTIRVRRAAPTRRIRLCRLDGSQAGLEIHASTADIVLAFGDRADRDRLVAALRHEVDRPA